MGGVRLGVITYERYQHLSASQRITTLKAPVPRTSPWEFHGLFRATVIVPIVLFVESERYRPLESNTESNQHKCISKHAFCITETMLVRKLVRCTRPSMSLTMLVLSFLLSLSLSFSLPLSHSCSLSLSRRCWCRRLSPLGIAPPASPCQRDLLL